MKVMKVYIGVDVGSVSTNIAILDPEGVVLDTIYTRTQGDPLSSVKRAMGEMATRHSDLVVLGAGTTGGDG